MGRGDAESPGECYSVCNFGSADGGLDAGRFAKAIGGFFVRGVVVFFREFCEKRCFLWWFFDGENVVECVVNVVFWQSVFRGEKMRQVFGIYF